jgi:hypothetical protein
MRTSRWPAATSDADSDPYIAGASDSTKELFRRFIATARSCGPVTFELQNGPIVLCGSRRIFASVVAGPERLSGHLVLAREVQDARINKVEPLTKRLYFHGWKISSLDALDGTFRELLGEARAIGDGAHLRPT